MSYTDPYDETKMDIDNFYFAGNIKVITNLGDLLQINYTLSMTDSDVRFGPAFGEKGLSICGREEGGRDGPLMALYLPQNKVGENVKPRWSLRKALEVLQRVDETPRLKLPGSP